MARQDHNMDQFEAYFRKADLDQDGRISGAEAVAFFQGTNLPKQVLAQIWMHADQSRSGYLGRAEFYNALKLVTVAQSKRELTPDIVKAALFGPASAKIPAPRVSFSASQVPQVNPIGGSPVPLPSALGSAASQNPGFRGQVPPNTSMNQQYVQPQVNQSPLALPSPTASHTPKSVAGFDFARGSSMSAPVLSNSNISSDWLGGASTGTTVHLPTTGVSSSLSALTDNPLSTSSINEAKNSKASVGSGNGFQSNLMPGGETFSAAQSFPKQAFSAPLHSASSAPASSAIVPVGSGTQSSVNPDPFESLGGTLTRQSIGGPQQLTQLTFKPNEQVSARSSSPLASSGMPVEVGNSYSNQSQSPWPKMTRSGVQKYAKVFMEVDTDRDGKITGEQARNLFMSWRLPREVLKQVWDLSDQDSDSMLSLREFCIALYLMERYREGRPLPPTLPNSVLLDETLLSLAGPPTAAAYGSAGWGPAPGLISQGITVAQPVASAALRPPVTSFQQAGGSLPFNQNAGLSSMEKSRINQLGTEEKNSLDLNSEKATETEEKKPENEEKVILDSREKIEFYRTKMQDLVLYKSRCDNRLNEIMEKAKADKNEAELLSKKYEEKYKQVAEIASKLTIEEASFRDIQERKMELHQAILKMEQGGSADGILQVRADRIQSNLEELLRALSERCKKHGVHIKSTALIELPPGWQPGIPEVSVVWDEDWDKFEDEGFSFDGAVSVNTNSIARNENFSSSNSFSPDSLSTADGKQERQGEHALENEVGYTHDEEESSKSQSSSPTRRASVGSPSMEYTDNHLSKSFMADTETNRSFDEPNWGTFDNNDDVDSVWGFNSVNVKDPDQAKHGGNYYFGSNDFDTSSARTESPQADNAFQKKSPFFEDSVPSTPHSGAGNSPPRYSIGSGDPFFDNMSRYDSFSMNDHEFSRREEAPRFDSMSSSFDHSRGFSFDDSDPFGSSGPFKVSAESKTPKRGSENWSAF